MMWSSTKDTNNKANNVDINKHLAGAERQVSTTILRKRGNYKPNTRYKQARVVMFLPWVVITGDFTRFLPAGKNTFGHGKYYTTKNKVQKDERLHVVDCLFCQRGARVSQFFSIAVKSLYSDRQLSS